MGNGVGLFSNYEKTKQKNKEKYELEKNFLVIINQTKDHENRKNKLSKEVLNNFELILKRGGGNPKD